MPKDLLIEDVPAALIVALGRAGAVKALEALKGAGWQVVHPSGPNGLHAFLDANTAHIGRKDEEALSDWAAASSDDHRGAAPYRTIAHSYGYFIHVPHDDVEDHEDRARDDGISEAFIRLQSYARERGCWWINLDRDADEVEGLPVHEW